MADTDFGLWTLDLGLSPSEPETGAAYTFSDTLTIIRLENLTCP